MPWQLCKYASLLYAPFRIQLSYTTTSAEVIATKFCNIQGAIVFLDIFLAVNRAEVLKYKVSEVDYVSLNQTWDVIILETIGNRKCIYVHSEAFHF